MPFTYAAFRHYLGVLNSSHAQFKNPSRSDYFFSGTYFILYDFIDFFEKDGPNYLPRDKFLEIVETIFKNVSKLEKDAIIFEVSPIRTDIII